MSAKFSLPIISRNELYNTIYSMALHYKGCGVTASAIESIMPGAILRRWLWSIVTCSRPLGYLSIITASC